MSGASVGLAFLGLFAVLIYSRSDEPIRPAGQSSFMKTTGSSAIAQNTSACTIGDFEVQGFKVAVYDDCRTMSCPVMKLNGRLKNNCSQSFGAELQVTAMGANGEVIDTATGWPASTRNIPPGEAVPFDLGSLMTYRKSMKSVDVRVVSVYRWR